jgi:hypothetical protein
MDRRAALDRLRTLRDEAMAEFTANGGCADPQAVRHVALILSASRGGSSMLYEVLSASESIVSLAGEHVPFTRLHGFDAPENADRSDALSTQLDCFDGAPEAARTLLTEARVGRGGQAVTAPAVALVAFRLSLQWPELDLSLAQLMAQVRAAADDATADLSADSDVKAQCHLALRTAQRLRRLGYPVDPAYYDCASAVSTAAVRNKDVAPPIAPRGPPCSRFCVEVPPFICPEPGRMPQAAELASKPLLLKASIDPHRVALFPAMFPAAEFTIIHLTRNPAASINGLRDAWLSHGFFSHHTAADLDAELRIPGYTDPAREWSGSWWNFDLPPGWRHYRDKPLLDVCAFQWRSAHTAILNLLDPATPCPLPVRGSLRIRIEELLNPATRAGVLAHIGDQLAPGSWAPSATELPVVMMTKPPRPGRWRAAAAEILPLVLREDNRDLAQRLGYRIDADTTLAELDEWEWA